MVVHDYYADILLSIIIIIIVGFKTSFQKSGIKPSHPGINSWRQLWERVCYPLLRYTPMIPVNAKNCYFSVGQITKVQPRLSQSFSEVQIKTHNLIHSFKISEYKLIQVRGYRVADGINALYSAFCV